MLDLYMAVILVFIALLMVGLLKWADKTIEEGSERG
ncbi:MAG: hypothetical protein K0Q90_3603 [Paenibacillaceae bacterium]|jgi:hypothetical protein|nr:hypothetical protein [Paenibacillaceae bacterium]